LPLVCRLASSCLCVSVLWCPHSSPASPTRRSSDLPLRRKVIGDPCRDASAAIHTAHRLAAVIGDEYPHLIGIRTDKRVLAVLHRDRKSTRLNSSHVKISHAVFCLKKKNRTAVAVCT